MEIKHQKQRTSGKRTRKVSAAFCQKIKIAKLQLLDEVQTRAILDNKAIKDYMRRMNAGDRFPAITVFKDGKNYIVADGFHRVMAAKLAGKNKINAEIKEGAIRDATLFALGANATHGVRRTNDDKRRAVRILLHDKEWKKWSNGKIAEQCGVSQPFVGRQRRKATQNGFELLSERIGRDGRRRNTKNIGKRRSKIHLEEKVLINETSTVDKPSKELCHTVNDSHRPKQPKRQWKQQCIETQNQHVTSKQILAKAKGLKMAVSQWKKQWKREEGNHLECNDANMLNQASKIMFDAADVIKRTFKLAGK